jgi:hypothetical protein
VTGNDLVVVAYQHRIGKPECLDAVGDLPDLLFGMVAGVLGVGPEFRYWNNSIIIVCICVTSEKATSQIGGEMTVFLENWASTDNRESRS